MVSGGDQKLILPFSVYIENKDLIPHNKHIDNNNTFANIKIYCFGNEVRFPETKIRVSGNPLRAMNETNIQLAMVL